LYSFQSNTCKLNVLILFIVSQRFIKVTSLLADVSIYAGKRRRRDLCQQGTRSRAFKHPFQGKANAPSSRYQRFKQLSIQSVEFEAALSNKRSRQALCLRRVSTTLFEVAVVAS
jgi:hypothetical protein